MLKRLLSRVLSSDSTVIASPRKAAMENLETRVLLHNPTVIRGTADNRGEVQLTLDADSAELSASSFNKNSVQMYEAGPDGILANADDVRVSASIRFTPSNQRLLIRGDVTAGNGYRIKIVSSRIPVSPGFALDGNFNGTFPSGDGSAGGNFEMQVKNDKGTRPTLKMYTSAGIMSVSLFRDLAPKNVNNFLRYANAKAYDNFFFTRAVQGFVIQGGGATLNSSEEIVANVNNGNVQGEPGVSNTRGRLSMALSTGPNSGTNQFFFNIGDNSQSLDGSGNGGPFTAFGELRGSGDLAVMDAIGNKDLVALHNPGTGNGIADPVASTGLTEVPVNDDSIPTGPTETVDQFGTQRKVVTGNFDPNRDLVIIRRTVLMSRIAAL